MKKYKPILDDYKSEYEDFNGYSISCYDKNYDLLNFSPGPASIPKKVFNKLYFEIFNNEKYVPGNTPFNYKDLVMVEPLRVSLYNGISINDTKHLINTMSEFIKLI